jgi:hypothetical protein
MKTYTYSEAKAIIEFCQENDIDFKEVIENMTEETNEFEVSDYRFILETDIDEIQKDELESDAYILGCFNADFISDNSDLSYDIVKALQEGEKFEELGNHLIDNDSVLDMQQEYARLDGYGHHFSYYDGSTHEDLIHLGYYAFRVN